MNTHVALFLLSAIFSLSKALVFRSTVNQFAECGYGIGVIFESFQPTIANANVIHELLKSPNHYFEEKWEASFQEDGEIKKLFPLLEYPKYHETLFSGEFVLSNPSLADAFFGGSNDAKKTIYTGNLLVKLRNDNSSYEFLDGILLPLLEYSVRNNLSQAESYDLFELFIDRDASLMNVLLDELSSQNHITPAILHVLPHASFNDNCEVLIWMHRYLNESLPKDQLMLRMIILMDKRQSELSYLINVSVLVGKGQNADHETFLKDKFNQIENNHMTLFDEISNMKNTPDSPEDLRYQATCVSAHVSIGIATLKYVQNRHKASKSEEEWDRVMNPIQSILFDEEYKSKVSPVEKRWIISSIMNDLLEEKYFWTAKRRNSFLEQVRQNLPLNSIPESFWPVEEKLKRFKREANVMIINSAAQNDVDLPNFDVDLEVDDLPTLPINLLVPSPQNESEYVHYHSVLIDEMRTFSNKKSNFHLRNGTLFLSGEVEEYYKLAASWVYLLYFNMKVDLSSIFGSLSQKNDWGDFVRLLANYTFVDNEHMAINKSLLDAVENYSIPSYLSLEEFRQLVDSSFKSDFVSKDRDFSNHDLNARNNKSDSLSQVGVLKFGKNTSSFGISRNINFPELDFDLQHLKFDNMFSSFLGTSPNLMDNTFEDYNAIRKPKGHNYSYGAVNQEGLEEGSEESEESEEGSSYDSSDYEDD